MTDQEPQPSAQPPRRSFQFTLRTLLLSFVVLASSLAVFGGWGLVVFGLVVGVATYIRHAGVFKPLGCVSLFLILSPLLASLDLLSMHWSAVYQSRESFRRTHCERRMRSIALALQEYHQAKGCFPPTYIADKAGKPIHSWRTLIFPYLVHDPRWIKYNISQPWDGPANAAFGATQGSFYVCPSALHSEASSASRTDYLAVVGPGAAWTGEKSRSLADFDSAGGAGHTIMVVEVVGSTIPWMEPLDLSLENFDTPGRQLPAPALASGHGRCEDFFFVYDRGPGINVVMADGGVRFLRTSGRSNQDLARLFQVGGCREEDFGPLADAPEGRRLNWPNLAALAVWLLSVGTLLIGAVRGRKARLPASSPG